MSATPAEPPTAPHPLPYALAVGLGAALLFAVQPIAAHGVLPAFGGAPAVWTTALLFFQTLLLLGYAWAHLLTTRFGARAVPVHLAVVALAAVALPILPGAVPGLNPETSPVLAVLAVLGRTVGLPYFALAATAPLVQARAAAAGVRQPYVLYAFSNLGSLGAVLLHPLVLDPWVGARAQAAGWSWGYGLFALTLAAALWPVRHRQTLAAAPVRSAEDAARPQARTWRWVVYPALGSALLLAVSEAITADLSVSPVFWVLPLGLYLASFVLVFGRPGWAPRRVFGPLLALSLAGLAALQLWGYAAPWWAQVGGYTAALGLSCVFLHGELVRARPEPARLTAFYLWQSVGGALGGLAVAVLGPTLLPLPMELPLAVAAAAILALVEALARRPATAPREGPRVLALLAGAALLVALAVPVWKRMRGGAWLTRSFYGALQVRDFLPHSEKNALRHLLDGRISHGFQYLREDRRREPTAYFAAESGIGRLLSAAGPPRAVGVLGLGAGTLAAYGRAGDRFVFYEINPDVVAVARSRFSFLSDTPAEVRVETVDGRLGLAREAPQGFALLALDAFSGDAIPTHLITREGVALALSHLAPGGVLAINASNRHVDLGRVVRAHAAHFGLRWRFVRHTARSPLGPYRSDWYLLSADEAALAPVAEVGSDPPDAEAAPVVFTDDHAPVFSILR